MTGVQTCALPILFFESVMDHDDEFLDKAVEGAVMFALNQGEICTCPSRMLIQESIYDRFIEKVIARRKLMMNLVKLYLKDLKKILMVRRIFFFNPILMH